MSVTTFSFPTRTLLGVGALRELPAQMLRLGIRRPLVVTDAGVTKKDSFREFTTTLGGAGEGSARFLYSGVHSNPVEQDVRDCAAAFRANKADGVVAIGGGSALDVGKAARVLVKRPDFDLTKFYDETDWSGLVPFVAIPTTAGTGSEVGLSSVITLAATQRKAVLFHATCSRTW